MEAKAKDSKATTPVIKQEVLDLADQIRKDIKIDKASGVATVSPDLYEKTLPDGITASTIKEIQDHNTRFAAAGLLALGEESVPLMKKAKDLEQTTLDVPTIGKDSFSFQFARSRTVPDRDSPDGGTKVKHGSGSVSFNMYGAGSRGEVKKVKQTLAEKALAAFGS